jgi:hypothetical protein
MKRMVFLFALCLVAFGASSAYAQQPQIKILANSKEVSGNLMLNGTQRLTFIVTEANPASAYEFGAIQLIPAQGAAVELRPLTLENRSNTVYSLRSSLLQTYPQGFKLKMNGISAVEPSGKRALVFQKSDLEINVVTQ